MICVSVNIIIEVLKPATLIMKYLTSVFIEYNFTKLAKVYYISLSIGPGGLQSVLTIRLLGILIMCLCLFYVHHCCTGVSPQITIIELESPQITIVANTKGLRILLVKKHWLSNVALLFVCLFISIYVGFNQL